MTKALAWLATLALALLPVAAISAPITLKLAFFASDQSTLFRSTVQPFVDAVNAEGKGLVEIVVYSGGVLGREVAQQPQVALDGTADIAYLVPGYTPALFPDNEVLELPGLYRDEREASLVFTRLIARNALRGYDDYVVLGAYVTEPETFHGRQPIGSVNDLSGRTIRINNTMETAALEKLGALPIPLELSQIADALSSGEIDATVLATVPLADFGVKRIATNHFMLGLSGAPIALVMNRKVFEALPQAAQDLIAKYSGEWTAARYIEVYGSADAAVVAELEADARRTVVLPSPADLEQAHTAFQSVISDWLKTDPRNQGLLDMAQTELTGLRAAE
ncbi:MAG: TRAP transporter substrate-binding protein DctP [Devosia nanyangense]|uniref:TRAP transporter substrate-binding protein DctP n=1 Tax=Devosia nanyangense TaxID=1228055 RepID=A0A933L708_9HYPH|nr:TRAP transporter substrate-binding protein DctP [Devosia nanyangense]